MTTKKQVFTLSYMSFVSFAIISVLTTYLFMNDTPFNFISDSLTCIKVTCVVVSLLTGVTFVINSFYNSDSFQSQIQGIIIIKAVLFLIIACILFHVITILFGAPFFEKTTETFHFAVLMTVLVALPCCLVSGPNLEDWLEIYTQDRAADLHTVVYFSTLGAYIGGWCGAVPIPLDWDRSWQEWPISCCIGAIAGYCGGLFLASLYLPHKYNQLPKSKRS